MSLSPRAIALQGVGFGALFVALQGFTAVVVPDQGGGGGTAVLHRPYLRPWRQPRPVEEDEALLLTVLKDFR